MERAERRILLIGAGRSRVKKAWLPGGNDQWNGELVTVDINPECGADIVHDMGVRPFPFRDSEFDEIHAYDCMEHWGTQGDWRGWFDEMAEFHRILKPKGTMTIGVPVGGDWFADPGHTRFFSKNHFAFLCQRWYDEQHRQGAPVSDYRWYWKLNFEPLAISEVGSPAHHLIAILRKE